MRIQFLTIASALLLTSCQPAPPPPAPAPPPQTPPPPPPPAVAADWGDLPLTQGTWRYSSEAGDSIAIYGEPQGTPPLIARCRAVSRSITLEILSASQSATARITTSYGALDFPSRKEAAGSAYAVVNLPASQSIWDQIAYSRGRFMIELAGSRLIFPTWPEIARVIEDCRS